MAKDGKQYCVIVSVDFFSIVQDKVKYGSDMMQVSYDIMLAATFWNMLTNTILRFKKKKKLKELRHVSDKNLDNHFLP